ncbi:MAG: hypothetical protein WB988_17780 [Candidatus Nitrosopolaris sp.]
MIQLLGANVKTSVPGLTSTFTSGNAYVAVHTQQHKERSGEIRDHIAPANITDQSVFRAILYFC